MALLPTLLFLAVVALATAAQSLTGFAFALILVGLAGVFELPRQPAPSEVFDRRFLPPQAERRLAAPK